ncbi:relaxase/mobilization nuclease domain-containing protein [Mesorhizobium sp. VK4C]|uniref:relaxase/mobilization nuclease domain-containing protein n=1 Tax=Mesorhizobium captivum TaxID=3072319 RepID=UPI002A23AD39|nr:relaxase/mobilization nuclease domain-containing protein [Mesorhizobium sp. VK4C]MDX8499107.1 relaxase/mobilization nuclease domain-containing protein [Mesorhizobium sp. VK4C]
MSGRLAGYAAEIERYLRMPGAGDLDDLDDDMLLQSARRETADLRAMNIHASGVAAGRRPPHQAGGKWSTASAKHAGASPGLAMAPVSSGSRGGPLSAIPLSGASASVRSSSDAKGAIAIFGLALGAFIKEEEEEWGRRGGGGRSGALPSARHFARSAREARAVAARAAYAAGAQPAVFKVLSSAANGKQAGALLAYVGTRANEQGEKRDIEIFTDSGQGLANAQDRRGFLHQFTVTFQAQLENTNFIEVRFELAGEVADETLSEALRTAFGSKPFVYARQGITVDVYSHTEERAAPLAKILATGRTNSRSKALDKVEAGLREALGQAGVRAAPEVTAAVGNERKAQYFLQKFIRSHKQVRQGDGQAVSSKQPTKAAAAIFEQWRPQLSGRERRNAYHLLFSARAGTDPQTIMAAARAVLEERAPGHKFVLAHHAETKHVHIHAMVQARSADGERLTFYKADLYAWRDAYAEQARQHGIAMVATRRYDHAMSRPYTKEHAGAYKRAQNDPRYQVSDKTVTRVEDKRQRRIDRGLLVANGAAIAGVWEQTAAVMRAAGVTGQALTAAQAIGNNVLQIHAHRAGEKPVATVSKGGGGPGRTSSFLSHPGMKELTRLIGATEMAQTPLEMRQKMARVNRALDQMRDTLPNTEQTRFEQYRDGVNDKMHDRLARLQFEQQKSASGAGEAAPEREARSRDLPAREETRQPEISTRHAEKARQRVQQQKDAARQKGRQADEQDRKTQRSQDEEYER